MNRHDTGKPSKTTWARVDKLADAELDDPETPPLDRQRRMRTRTVPCAVRALRWKVPLRTNRGLGSAGHSGGGASRPWGDWQRGCVTYLMALDQPI